MKHFKKLSWPYVLWSFLLIVLPLILIVLYAVTESSNSLVNIRFTTNNFAKIFEPEYIKVFIKSFRLGIVATAICFFVGYPLAYFISNADEDSQSLLILLITIPMWINTLLRTYAWISLLANEGLINSMLKYLGINPVTMMYTDFSVMIGLVCDLLPFMVIPIHTSLTKMDHSLVEAAADLGANKIKTFTNVIWKLSLPGVINGVTIVFLLSISTFVIPKLLGGAQYTLIGNLIEQEFISIGDWNFGSAISLLLAFVIVILMRIINKIDPDEKGGE
ncbi:MAG: ABC transporter permease [Lachnospiraceae bacterium]|nr:ABC transporter permease [Lachnospiraceae bacterium]